MPKQGETAAGSRLAHLLQILVVINQAYVPGFRLRSMVLTGYTERPRHCNALVWWSTIGRLTFRECTAPSAKVGFAPW